MTQEDSRDQKRCGARLESRAREKDGRDPTELCQNYIWMLPDDVPSPPGYEGMTVAVAKRLIAENRATNEPCPIAVFAYGTLREFLQNVLLAEIFLRIRILGIQLREHHDPVIADMVESIGNMIIEFAPVAKNVQDETIFECPFLGKTHEAYLFNQAMTAIAVWNQSSAIKYFLKTNDAKVNGPTFFENLLQKIAGQFGKKARPVRNGEPAALAKGATATVAFVATGAIAIATPLRLSLRDEESGIHVHISQTAPPDFIFE